LARELWPDALIVWGGHHVSRLGETIQQDIRRRSFAADLFVLGHAERTFVDALNSIDNRNGGNTNAAIAGI